MTAKSLGVAAIVAAATLAAAGCVSGSGTGSKPTSTVSGRAAVGTPPAGGMGGSVAILSLVPNAFDACINKAMAATLKDADLTSTVYYSNFEPAVSSQNIQDAITKGTEGAIYASQTPALDLTSLQKLRAANIKTTFDLGPAVPGTHPEAILPVAFDEVGADAVQDLLKLHPGITQVGLIPGTAGVPASDLTLQGMVSALAKHGIKPVVVHGAFTAQSGSQVSQDMLPSHPSMQAMIVLGDDMALGAARVAATSPGHPAVVDSYGFSQPAFQAVKNGELAALVYTPLANWGTQIAKAMIAVMHGSAATTPQLLYPQVVDRDNVAYVHSGC